MVVVDGHPCVALLDTGADVTVMSEEYYNTLPPTLQAKATVPPSTFRATLHGIGGQTINLLKFLDCQVGLPVRTTQHRIYVVKGIHHPFILGAGLIATLGWGLDLRNARIIIDAAAKPTADNLHPLFDVTAPETHLVRLSKRFTIPARSETIVPVDLHPAFSGVRGIMLCPRPDRSTALAVPYTLADVSTDIAQPRAFIRIMNLGYKKIALPRGATIAYVAPNSATLTHDTGSVLAVEAVTQARNALDQLYEDHHAPEFDNDDEIAMAFDERHDRILPSTAPPPFSSSPTTDQRHAFIREKMNISSTVTDTQRQSLLELLCKHHQTVSVNKELGLTSTLEHRIEVGAAQPFAIPPRRYPAQLQSAADTIIDDLLKQGCIEPASSPWNAPVRLARKPDGSWRFCVDFRGLNRLTTRDVHPLPLINELLDTLQGKKFFTTMDLASAFYQVPVFIEHRPLTAFATLRGQWQWKTMPMGLTNAPATFQRLANLMLSGLAWQSCLAYLDDIVVFSNTFEEHIQHLDQVLSRFEQHGLKLKLEKSVFAAPEIHFLGHVVNGTTIKPMDKNVEPVRQMPDRLSSYKEVRSFLGLINFYRRFIPKLAHEAIPLYALLQRHKKGEPPPLLVWTDACTNAVQRLKHLLTTEPCMLYLPNLNVPFVLDTDASDDAAGAVLSQLVDGKERVVAYFSRVFKGPQLKYSVTQRECLAAVWAVQHFRCYLQSGTFTLITDHSALKTILDPNTVRHSGDAMLTRWALELQGHSFKVVHRPGLAHGNADALSRMPIEYHPQKRQPVLALLQNVENAQDVSSSSADAGSIPLRDRDAAPVWFYPERETPSPEFSSRLRQAQRKSGTIWAELIGLLEGTRSPDTIVRDRPDMADFMLKHGTAFFLDPDGLLCRTVTETSSDARVVPTQRMVYVIPEPLVEEVLRLCHDDTYVGHRGINSNSATRLSPVLL